MHRGHTRMYDYDWKGAESDFKRALELNPGQSDCHAGYSHYLAAIGHVDEAILEAKRAVELDPLSSWHRFAFCLLLCFSGEFDKAIEISKEFLELDPDNAFVSSTLALAYGGKGIYEKGISILQRFKDIPLFASYLGYLYGMAGKVEEAQKILNDFLEQSKKGYFSPYFIAKVYSGLDEKDKVFEWLDRAYEVRAPQFFIKVDIELQHLHSDPRWTEQLKKRGLAD